MDSEIYEQQPLSDLVKIPKWDTNQTRQVVKALDESGLSIRKFSQSNGLGYWRVMNAKRRLNTKARDSKTAMTQPALVPVTVTTDSQAAIGRRERWVLEIEMNRCMVRVSEAVSEQVLAATLRAVRGLPC